MNFLSFTIGIIAGVILTVLVINKLSDFVFNFLENFELRMQATNEYSENQKTINELQSQPKALRCKVCHTYPTLISDVNGHELACKCSSTLYYDNVESTITEWNVIYGEETGK